jgi:phage terminase small subunit
MANKSPVKKNGATGEQMLTVKMEAFCNEFVITGNQSGAYRAAYNAENMKPATIHSRSCELMKNSKVRARVSELRAAIATKHGITVDSLLAELEDSRQLAIEERQSAAATAATMGKAKLLNLDRLVVIDEKDKTISLIQRVIVD